MRWKLIRRRLSVSAPRMIVRSHLPWPLRWAVVALMLGFSAALALWAFEVGRNLAGLGPRNSELSSEAARLRQEVAQLREEREKAQSIANTADSLLKAERAAQERLADQVRTLETENLALKGDLGFFERLLPTGSHDGLAVRALQAQVPQAGQLRFQLLVMQGGRNPAEFSGRYEVSVSGSMDNKPWTFAVPSNGNHSLQFKQYQRVEGVIQYPAQAAVRQVLVRVLDASGSVRATQQATL